MADIEKYQEKEKWLEEFTNQRPDLFFPESWNDEQRAEAVEQIRTGHIKKMMYSSIPMNCKGPKCPVASSCPLLKRNLAPTGNPCPIEMAMVIEFMKDYTELWGVEESNMAELGMIRDLVNQEVQHIRQTKVLADEHFIQDTIVGIDERTGEPLIRKELHVAVDYEDKILKRKNDIHKKFMATREMKAKLGVGQLDTAQALSDIMGSIREVERKREDALREKLGIAHQDDYILEDMASRDDIEDAEVIEDDQDG